MFCVNEAAGEEHNLFEALTDDAIPVLRSIVESSPDCFKILKVDGHLAFMNENGRRIMEIDDLGRVLGEHWSSLWPDAERPTIDDALQKASNGTPVRFEAFCPTAKGRAAWWDITLSPISGADGSIVFLLSVSREITHRIQLETSLKEREAELERLIRRQAAS